MPVLSGLAPSRPSPSRLAGAAAATLLVGGLPAVAVAHGLSPIYQSPLPLEVYLVGAAATVALSFILVLARDLRAESAPPGRASVVSPILRLVLRSAGVLAWIWIIAQGIAGGSSAGSVATLFLWVYGWVGLALMSAFVYPVWEWLDPFATLFGAGAWLGRRMGLRSPSRSPIPARAGTWPAAAGFVFFVWLELVAVPDTGTLTLVLAAYTAFTLAMMARYGRDEWRAQGETFTVWFRTLNRLSSRGLLPAAGAAPDGAVDKARINRRPFASASLDALWTRPRIVLVALGVGSIIFDGLSQTVPFAAAFGAPSMLPKTLLLLAFLALVAGAALLVARTVSPGAIGAGLLPIAVGYLAAHYLTYLLIDGQRMVIAMSDPLQTGADLFGTAFWTPTGGWLPPGLVWTMQLAAVVGGHMLGAWSGHVTAQRDMAPPANPGTGSGGRDLRHRKIHDAPRPRNVRLREIPLAVVMVALTTLTLWSLGQAIVVAEEVPAAGPPQGAVAGQTVLGGTHSVIGRT